MVVVAKKRKGGRPRLWTYHKAYFYVNRKGERVAVKAHKEKYSK